MQIDGHLQVASHMFSCQPKAGKALQDDGWDGLCMHAVQVNSTRCFHYKMHLCITVNVMQAISQTIALADLPLEMLIPVPIWHSI